MSDDFKENSEKKTIQPEEKKMTLQIIFLVCFVRAILKDNNKRFENKDGDPKYFIFENAYKYACDLLGVEYAANYFAFVPINWRDILKKELSIKKIKASINSAKEKAKRESK